MEPADPVGAPQKPRPDPVERAALLVASVVLALLLLWSVEGLQTRDLVGARRWAWGAIAVASGLAWFSLLAALRSPQPLERLGLVPANLHTVIWGCLGIAALSHGLDSSIEWIAPGGSPGVRAVREVLASLPRDELPFVLAAAAGLTPLGEELFFRGLVQRGIARRGSPTLAIVLAALLFGAAHGDWLYGAAAAVLGAALGVLVHWSGSLLPALLAHGANNLIAVLQASGRLPIPALLETPWIGTLVGVGVGLTALWWALRPPGAGRPLDIPPRG